MYGQPTYYPSPAMQTAQQRLQMMEAQYPQFANPAGMGYPQPNTYNTGAQQPAPSAPMIKGRPVSNEEEANAAMIDFDGSLFVFPDKAHGRIYTKQLGLDGNIVFMRYSLDTGNQGVNPQASPSAAPSPAPVLPDMSEFVRVDDLNKRLKEIQDQFSGLEKCIPTVIQQSGKGGGKG